jgi:hypothetical protein
MKRFILLTTNSLISLLFLSSIFTLCFAQMPILDENGNKTGVYNMNPDPEGEPWMAGGFSYSRTMDKLKEIPFRQGQTNRVKEIPVAIDHSTTKYFRPVFSQGQTGSCAQASTIGYIFTYEINTHKDADGSTSDNQFSFGFTYNLYNRGSGDSGTYVVDGWNCAQLNGLPTVAECGFFMPEANSTKWLDGYDKWYSGTPDRVLPYEKGIWQIDVSTQGGIDAMKQWITDRMGTSTFGGCCLFMCWCSGWDVQQLPAGSVDPGHTIITRMALQAVGAHAICISGFNDEVEYDLNGNGTIEDDEKGAIMMVNSWGATWEENGKAYVPYKVLMTPEAQGGIWLNRVLFIETQVDYKAALMYKMKLTHESRKHLRIRAGYALDTTATAPEDTSLCWPYLFEWSGGAFPMQGSGLSSTIELGLDASFMTDYLTPNPMRLFLQLESKGGGTGTAHSFSVIDYAGTSPLETVSPDVDKTIIPGNATNSIITLLSLVWKYNGPYILAITSPSNGEGYVTGMTMSIKFSCTAPGPVKLVLNKADVEDRVISASTENDGQFDWVIPHDVTESDSCSVSIFSVGDPSATATSDGYFTIIQGSPIVNDYSKALSTLNVKHYCHKSQIHFDIPDLGIGNQSNISLKLYDLKGKLIKTFFGAGHHSISVANGTYLYKIEAEGFKKSSVVMVRK